MNSNVIDLNQYRTPGVPRRVHGAVHTEVETRWVVFGSGLWEALLLIGWTTSQVNPEGMALMSRKRITR